MMKYIQNSVLSFNESKKEYNVLGIPVYLLVPFTKKINFNLVLQQVEKLIPRHLLRNVEIIYVANIKDFNKDNSEFNALYKDGAIYLSPEQDNEKDLLDDIIHEIAHSFEKDYQEFIFEDGSLESEFLGKRRKLYYLIDKPTVNMLVYNNPEYDARFDYHLYNELDYDYLRTVSSQLFYSPYAITSLREYWANGFENYLLGDKQTLRDLSPILYNKIETIIDNSEEI